MDMLKFKKLLARTGGVCVLRQALIDRRMTNRFIKAATARRLVEHDGCSPLGTFLTQAESRSIFGTQSVYTMDAVDTSQQRTLLAWVKQKAGAHGPLILLVDDRYYPSLASLPTFSVPGLTSVQAIRLSTRMSPSSPSTARSTVSGIRAAAALGGHGGDQQDKSTSSQTIFIALRRAFLQPHCSEQHMEDFLQLHGRTGLLHLRNNLSTQQDLPRLAAALDTIDDMLDFRTPLDATILYLAVHGLTLASKVKLHRALRKKHVGTTEQLRVLLGHGNILPVQMVTETLACAASASIRFPVNWQGNDATCITKLNQAVFNTRLSLRTFSA